MNNYETGLLIIIHGIVKKSFSLKNYDVKFIWNNKERYLKGIFYFI